MVFHRLLLGTGLLSIGLTGCGGLGGTHPTGTGPFDTHGNYVEAWADDPSKWNGRSVPLPESKPAPQIAQAPKPQAVAAHKPAPAPVMTSRPTPPPRVQTVSNPAPKPKPVPKPQPKFASHQVRKGDTLYGLAKKYGTTVNTIQRANGISGSVIRLGQTLRIPL